MIKRVTLTGPDDSIQPQQILDLSKEFPFVEWGILISGKRYGTNRFPSLKWLDDLLDNVQGDEDVNLSGHLCGQYVRDILMGYAGDMERELSYRFEMFNRVQINTHGQTHHYNHAGLSYLRHEAEKEFIFQYDEANPKLLVDAVASGINCSTLFDVSHGAGVVPDKWPSPFLSFKCGYAGGIGPDNIEEQIKKVEEASADKEVWIDMETKIRSNNDQLFDIKKCREVLEVCAKYVSP